MKKALLVLLATGWFLCGFGQEIKFETIEHDFGMVNYNVPAVFTNTGTEPLIVQKPKSSCGCTIPFSWPKEPIMPGKNGTIKVEYKTNRSGQINRTVTVLSNAKSSPQVTLRVKGKVLDAGQGVKVITQNGQFGMEDDNGKIIIPVEYEKIQKNSHGDFQLKKHGKWGAANETGHIYIPCEYDEEFDLEEKSGWVKKAGKWGVINKKNKVVIPFEYEEIHLLTQALKRGIAKKGGKWGEVDMENNTVIIPFEYEDLIPDILTQALFAKKNGKWGVIDNNGKTIIIPFEYKEVSEVTDAYYKKLQLK